MNDEGDLKSYQDALEEQIKRIPRILLSDIIDRKLEKQGIKLSDQIFEKLIDHLEQGGTGTFSIPDEEIEFIDRESNDLNLEFTKQDTQSLKEASKAFEKSLPKLIKELAKKFSKDVVKRSKMQWLEDYPLRLSQRYGFEERLKYRWRDGLIPLGVMMEVTREFSSSVLDRHHDTVGTKEFSVKLDALTGLHVRACQVSAEIITLLESGYADGAMARWRTLHELVVVADLIHDEGDGLAQRYLDHNVIDAKRAADRYMETVEMTGYEPISKEELEAIEEDYQLALKTHGKGYGKEYGWAATIFDHTNIRFVDLIKKSGRQNLQSYYKMASFNVHANSRSLFQRQTSMASHSGLIAGSSNAGLVHPGINTAYSLSQITALLLPENGATLDDIVAVQTIARLRNKAEKGFTKCADLLDEEDQEHLELSERYGGLEVLNLDDFERFGVEFQE